MPTLAELIDASPKILTYGRSGTGKSAFWATLGDACEFIETDPNGFTTLKYLKDEWTAERMKVRMNYFQDSNPMLATGWSALKKYVLMDINNKLVSGTYEKQVVVFDTLTSMSDLALRSVKSGKDIMAPKTTLEQWGIAMAEVEQIVVIARSWNIPVVFLGHQEIKEVDEQTRIQPSMIGQKLLPKVLNYMEEIYYAKVEPLPEGKQKFCLQTVQSPAVEVKSRRNLPNNWDMKQGARALFSAINHPLK